LGRLTGLQKVSGPVQVTKGLRVSAKARLATGNRQLATGTWQLATGNYFTTTSFTIPCSA
jgi:hypothetical protein